MSRIGQAYLEASDETLKKALRVTAEAAMSFESASAGLAAAFISAGAVILLWSLFRSGRLPAWITLAMMGAALIPGIQHWRVPLLSRIPFGEFGPYWSTSFVLAGLGLVFLRGVAEDPVERGLRHEKSPEAHGPEEGDEEPGRHSAHP
jgi:hypothetical protein